MKLTLGLLASTALFLVNCASADERAGSLQAALGSASCGLSEPCASPLVCVENAAGPGQNHCEAAHALYSFLESDPDNLDVAIQEMLGVWRTERAQTKLLTISYPLQLASGESVVCKDSNTGPAHACLIPDWQAYVLPEAIADKYDRFALFGLRPLRFLVSAWRHETDERLSAAADAAGLSLSPTIIRANMRSTYLAALDSFAAALPLAFALPSDPAPSTAAGWLNPNAPFDPGLALWDPGYNDNCKVEKSVFVPGFGGLSYYDLRSSLWDRHATAFRGLSFLNGYFHARGLLTPEQTARWLNALHRDADALALSGSFEPGENHGITEAAALLQLATELDGTSAPRLGGSPSLTAAWQDVALQRLNAVISQTLLADGAQVEQSLFYHDYELSFLVEIQEWLRSHPELQLSGGLATNRYDFAQCQNGRFFDHHIEPDPALDLSARAQAATRVATHTAMPSTEVPMIGSSPTSSLGFWDHAFDRYVAGDSSEVARQLQFVRTQGADGAAIPLSQRMQVFPLGGYVTLRSAFTPNYAAQTHLLFRVGAPANAHSHLDALALHLYGEDPTTPSSADGLPLLADSGWFSYTSSQRHYFEGTGAHSTVSVDGLNQCGFDVVGMRADPTDAESELVSCANLNDGYAAERGHLGKSLSDPSGAERVLYQSAEVSLYPGVVHRRGVALLGRDLVMVLDRLESAQAHVFQQNWQLAPAIKSIVQLQADGSTAHYAFNNARGAALFSGHFSTSSDSSFAKSWGTCGTCSGDLCAGTSCDDPRQGWYSIAENRKAPAWMLRRKRTGTDVTWGSAFLLGSLAAQNSELALTELGANDYRLDAVLQDGMPVSLRTSSFATINEQVAITYPGRGAFMSYSFEGQPRDGQDLKEGLSVSVSVPGQTSGNVVSKPGVVGNAYQYIAGGSELGSGGSFAFMHKPDARFSLSFWMRMSTANLGATGGTQAIFSTATWSSAGTGIQVYFQDDASRNNSLRFVIRGGGTTLLSFASPGLFVPEDTAWHHYVLVFDPRATADQIHIYRDGGNASVGQFAGSLPTAAGDATPTIGKKPGSGVVYPLQATLDELVTFKRALSESEVAALYNSGDGMRAH